ncbi:MAG: hypothetical protein K2O32_00015 [Acetatifactor sp.]|nr:hypothetical protein [Acetatifactor sp.]
MENENEDKRIVKIVTITMASMFLGVVLIILSFIFLPKFLNGPGRRLFPEGKIAMTKRVLREKYGEEFIVHDVYSKASHEYFADCSPVSNEEIVFQAAVWKDGSGVVYDEYIQNIVAREIEKGIEEELQKYYDSVFVKVYITGGVDVLYGEVKSAQDVTMEEYIKRVNPSRCWIDVGIDAEDGKDHLEEEYAFYESIQEKINNQKCPPLHVVCYNMDAELQEWCNDFFTYNAGAYFTYTHKLAECNEMEYDCTAEGVNITYDEFKNMREELGKDE